MDRSLLKNIPQISNDEINLVLETIGSICLDCKDGTDTVFDRNWLKYQKSILNKLLSNAESPWEVSSSITF